MDIPAYTFAQYVQLALCVLYFVLTSAALRLRRSTWGRSPFLLLCLGYSVACAASNLMRAHSLDRTAQWVIAEEDYLRGTVVWWLSLISLTVGYLAIRMRHPKKVETPRPAARASRNRPEQFYAVLFVVGLTAFAFNPYRNVDFGHLNPSSPEAILIGGLLVSGVFTMMLTAGSLGLFIVQPVWGVLPVAATVGILTYSGSKGIGALLVIYIAYLIWKMRARRFAWRLANLLLPLVIYASGLALRQATMFRYGSSGLGLSGAVSMSLSRFTQQDVVAVLWANGDWMSDFSPRYSFAQVASFVPGFLWSDKPRNPAYEINALYARHGSVSAASPSVFGSLLIVFGPWWFLPAIALLGAILARLDRRISAFAHYREIEWTYLYSIAMMFETVYVLALFGFALTWCCLWATQCANMRRRPRTGATVSATGVVGAIQPFPSRSPSAPQLLPR